MKDFILHDFSDINFGTGRFKRSLTVAGTIAAALTLFYLFAPVASTKAAANERTEMGTGP